MTLDTKLNQEIIFGRYTVSVSTMFSLILAMFLALSPELCLAAGQTMEQQLTTVNTLGNDKLKTVGFSLAGICIGLLALFRGSIQIALTSVGIGIIISLMLEWIKGGMVLLGTGEA